MQEQENGEYGGIGNSFSDKAVRLGFIRKVYSILCVQVLGIIMIFGVEENVLSI